MDKTSSLFRDAHFRVLWASQSLSYLGTYVTYVALPITAITLLHGTPIETGVLGALETVPFLVLGLLVGVFVDRSARRPVLFWASIVRFLALAWIPIAYWLDVLAMPQLYAVVLVVGIGTVFFEVAYPSYVPGLFGREKMVEANAKLQMSRSASEVLGPGITGGLIGLIGAPVLIIVDAVSYAVSAVAMLRLPADEAPASGAPAGAPATSLGASIKEGFDVIRHHTVLRVCTAAAVLTSFFFSALTALVFLFLIRSCGMTSTEVGLVLMVGSCGALAGALLTGWLTARLGVGLTVVVALAVPALGYVGLANVHGHAAGSVVLAALAALVAFAGIPVFDITVISLRQAVTPDDLLGRVNATVRTAAWGTWSLGSLFGGALGSAIGIRPAVLVSAVLLFSPSLLLLFSPVRSVRKVEDGMSTPGESPTEPHGLNDPMAEEFL